jgi:hypothetical protein
MSGHIDIDTPLQSRVADTSGNLNMAKPILHLFLPIETSDFENLTVCILMKKSRTLLIFGIVINNG